MKFELPELEHLYQTICSFDFYTDLTEEKLIKRLEVDKYEENEEAKESIKEAAINKLEKVQIKYSNSEDYIRIYYNLFLLETKAQITRSKMIEIDESEKFNLIFCRQDRKFYILEFTKNTKTNNVQYSSGDLVFISKFPIKNYNHKCHSLGIVEKFVNSVIHIKIILKLAEGDNDEKSIEIKNNLFKDTEWFITRICNLATLSREYQALMSIETYKLSELLIHPGNFVFDGKITIEIEKKNLNDYFYIPSQLEKKLTETYNASQFEALQYSIKKKGLTLIQGPPGTGKSTTILGILSVILNSVNKREILVNSNSILDNSSLVKNTKINTYSTTDLIYEKQHPWIYSSNYINVMDEPFVLNNDFNSYPKSNVSDQLRDIAVNDEAEFVQPEKILVCAPSNIAIDEIVNKIIQIGLIDSNGFRYHPKFVRIGPNFHPSVREYSLEYLINDKLSKEENKDIEKFKNEILTSVKIVCSTLSMAGSAVMTTLNQKFDTVVIDESAQAIEISTLIPLKYGCERLILVGDPKQLAATVFSRTALKYEYDKSMFQRFMQAGHDVVMLKTQYRMHKKISKFISDTFYEGNLLDDQNIMQNTTKEPCLFHPAFQPFTYYDIESEEGFDKNSFFNEDQIILILELYKQLKEIYTSKELIERLAIICPYSNQVYRIKENIKTLEGKDVCQIEVNTVDGFQGKEKNIIIFSTVRSLGSKSVGFLSDERRMNVGLSRAKSCLIVIGDSKKLITDKNWEKLVKYAFRSATFYKVKGKVKSFFEKFNENSKRFLVTNEEEFVRNIYSMK